MLVLYIIPDESGEGQAEAEKDQPSIYKGSSRTTNALKRIYRGRKINLLEDVPGQNRLVIKKQESDAMVANC